MFEQQYGEVFDGDEQWNAINDRRASCIDWDRTSTYIQEAAVLRRHAREPPPSRDLAGARVLGDARRLGDDRPHLAGRFDRQGQPGRQYLMEHGVEPDDFNSTARAAATTE